MPVTTRSRAAAADIPSNTPGDACSPRGGVDRVFSLAEVAAHSTPGDCWLIIHEKVYDVTEFVPRHPGGALIYVKAGRDNTALFESYHPEKVRLMLDKFCIGKVDPVERATNPKEFVTYENEGNDEFFKELKSNVQNYFKENNLDPRFSWEMYFKSAIIIAGVALGAYGTFFAFESLLASFLCAGLLGFAMAEVGVSIQHDANHGAYAHNGMTCWLMGLTLDAVGASSFMWKQQHVAGHHPYTNVSGEDPDIRVKPEGGDVRRVTQWQPQSSFHRFQHLYLGFLYGLLAIKSIFVDDFSALAEGEIGPVKLSKMTKVELSAFVSGKVLFALWFLALPLAASHHGVLALLGLWTFALAVTGWTLAFMFQVAHVVDEVDFVKADENSHVSLGWAEAQIRTSADFCHGSWLWTHISGGLNYQVVHHLFPGICHTHYPAIAPIIQKVAKKHDVPYKVYDTFLGALSAHFKHLANVGAPTAVPSLATVG